MNFAVPLRIPRLRLAVFRLGVLRVAFEDGDQFVVRNSLPDRIPHVKRNEKQQRHDRHVIGRRCNFPNLPPVETHRDQPPCPIPLGRNTTGRGLRSSLISDSSITGEGPDMPPSFRTRQKWTPMKIAAISGIAMQCQMYARKSAFASTMDPPKSANRTSLYGVIPNCAPSGPSLPNKGDARVIFVP